MGVGRGLYKIDSVYKNLIPLMCLLIICFMAFNIFYTWEGLSPGIGGWDRGEHHVKLLYLYSHERLPTTEIGTIVNPFYPSGFALATFFFSSIPIFVSPHFDITNLDYSLTFFMATVFSLITLTVYSLSELYVKNKNVPIYASFSFLIVAFHFIFHSMGSSLALVLIGAVVILFKKYAKNNLPLSYMLLSPLLLITILLLHPIMFLYSILMVFLLVMGWKVDDTITRPQLYNIFSMVLVSLISYALFMFMFNQPLLFGTLNYIGIHNAGDLPSSGVGSPFGILSRIFEFRYEEIIFYFTNAQCLLPFFVIGLIHSFKKHRDIFLMLIIAIFLSTSSLVWYTSRTWFYMIFPFTILSGIGIVRIFKTKAFYSICLVLILTSIIVPIAINNALMGPSPEDPYFWSEEWRINSYITQEEFELAEWIKQNNIKDAFIGTPNDSPGYQVIEALTDNKILMGSRYGAPQSFIDVEKIFLENVSQEDKMHIISNYNISILITHQENIVMMLTDQLPVEEIYHPTSSYWILILGDKK